MRNLRKAAVVVALVGSVGMLGAGSAAAYDGGDRGEAPTVNNPQGLNCAYTGNTSLLPINVALSLLGDASANQILGNTCPQTGPSIG